MEFSDFIWDPCGVQKCRCVRIQKTAGGQQGISWWQGKSFLNVLETSFPRKGAFICFLRLAKDQAKLQLLCWSTTEKCRTTNCTPFPYSTSDMSIHVQLFSYIQAFSGLLHCSRCSWCNKRRSCWTFCLRTRSASLSALSSAVAGTHQKHPKTLRGPFLRALMNTKGFIYLLVVWETQNWNLNSLPPSSSVYVANRKTQTVVGTCRNESTRWNTSTASPDSNCTSSSCQIPTPHSRLVSRGHCFWRVHGLLCGNKQNEKSVWDYLYLGVTKFDIFAWAMATSVTDASHSDPYCIRKHKQCTNCMTLLQGLVGKNMSNNQNTLPTQLTVSLQVLEGLRYDIYQDSIKSKCSGQLFDSTSSFLTSGWPYRNTSSSLEQPCRVRYCGRIGRMLVWKTRRRTMMRNVMRRIVCFRAT